MAQIKIMVDYEAGGIWCDAKTYARIPVDLRERLRDWNWWWEIGQYRLCADGIHWEHNPDFDHDACAWIGLGLAMQLQQAMPDDRVIFIHEAEWDRGFTAAMNAGHYNVPDAQYVYEIFTGPDLIEARPANE